MRFATLITLTALTTGAFSSPVSKRDAITDLTQWIEDAVNGFFPNHDGWETDYAEYYSESTTATFNAVSYNYTGLAGYYSAAHDAMKTYYGDGFKVEFTDVVAVPNANDIGGQIWITAKEGGTTLEGKENWGTDGAFGVIGVENGERKIIEWREASNFKFNAA